MSKYSKLYNIVNGKYSVEYAVAVTAINQSIYVKDNDFTLSFSHLIESSMNFELACTIFESLYILVRELSSL